MTMTYQQAVQNQWTVAYHRMQFAKEAQAKEKNPNCRCENCRAHLEAIEKGPEKPE